MLVKHWFWYFILIWKIFSLFEVLWLNMEGKYSRYFDDSLHLFLFLYIFIFFYCRKKDLIVEVKIHKYENAIKYNECIWAEVFHLYNFKDLNFSSIFFCIFDTFLGFCQKFKYRFPNVWVLCFHKQLSYFLYYISFFFTV